MGRSQFVLNLLASLLENESCFVVVATMKLRRGESTINDGQRLGGTLNGALENVVDGLCSPPALVREISNACF